MQTANALGEIVKLGLADFAQPVSVFAVPPMSFNPPAVIVKFPEMIEPSIIAPTIDRVQLALLVATGLQAIELLFDLLTVLREAVLRDRKVQGLAQSLAVVNYRAFGQMNVAGAEYLTAELLLEMHA